MQDEAIVKAVAGLRGFGKTTRVLNMTRDEPRVLFYDSLGNDYSAGVVCRELATLKKFWRSTYRGRFRIVYKPLDPLKDIADVCELAYACGDMVLVIDEVQLYFRGQWCAPELTKIITAGRHAGVGLVGVTQTPKKLGELLRSQAREWFIFATREPDHVKYLADRCIGVDPERIAALPKFEYLHYVDGADSYTRCMDNIMGRSMELEKVTYGAATAAPGPVANSGGHADAGDALAR